MQWRPLRSKILPQPRNFTNKSLVSLPPAPKEGGVVTLRSGNSTIVVYESQFAGTNKATSATWGVGKEMDSIVQNLKEAGVAFEHYDTPGLKREGDIHVAGDFKAVWFKDPNSTGKFWQNEPNCSHFR